MIQTARKSFILYNTDDDEDLDTGVNSEANSRRINNVEQSFGSSGQPLGLPGRVLVGEGVLTKMCRKRAKPRQFFLFNDVLVYGNIIIHKKKYNKQHILPLEDVKLDNVDDDGNLRNGWKIISPSKSFVVYAATATEKKEWMAHIRKCVNDILALRGIRQSTTVDSPVWVPDSEAKTCMHCRKSEFTVVNRRHHCRHCGIVACNACTSKKWLLPLQSSKPIRVCLTCYQKLSKEATDNNVTRKYSSVMTSGDNRNSSGEDSSDDDDDQFRNGGSEQLAINDAHFQSYD
ncbi:Pleckstrin y domain-containing F member 2 [Biomphalaria glabrata]|nr:pleckstrin homology domain-containing family F member 2-like [Biomphalaria glabrata]